MPNNLTFYDICHKITFAIWRPLTFQDPWHFVTFNTSWHLTLHDIFHFMTFFISLNNPLFKYIPHFGSFWHFVIYFQEYATCWVFLALHHMLYLCILYLYLSLSLYSSSPYDRRHRPLSINIWVFPRIHLADPPPPPSPSKCDKTCSGPWGPTDIKQIGTLAKGRQLKYEEFCHISRGGVILPQARKAVKDQ